MQIPGRTENCVHHWIIDAADSAYSTGKCARCGQEKKFINDWDELLTVTGKNGFIAKAKKETEYAR
jgi:hypothetical protein